MRKQTPGVVCAARSYPREEIQEPRCLLCCRPSGDLSEYVKIPAVLGTGKVSQTLPGFRHACFGMPALTLRAARRKVAGMCQDPAPQEIRSTNEPSSLRGWWVSHALE